MYTIYLHAETTLISRNAGLDISTTIPLTIASNMLGQERHLRPAYHIFITLLPNDVLPCFLGSIHLPAENEIHLSLYKAKLFPAIKSSAALLDIHYEAFIRIQSPRSGRGKGHIFGRYCTVLVRAPL